MPVSPHRGSSTLFQPARPILDPLVSGQSKHSSSLASAVRDSEELTGGEGGDPREMGGRGTIGEKWSQRILWACAIGTAINLYFVAVERQMQNRERAMAEGLKSLDGAMGGGSRGGENV